MSITVNPLLLSAIHYQLQTGISIASRMRARGGGYISESISANGRHGMLFDPEINARNIDHSDVE